METAPGLWPLVFRRACGEPGAGRRSSKSATTGGWHEITFAPVARARVCCERPMLTRYRWFAGTLARQAGREIRMIIHGTDPVAAAKPDGRLIKLLVRGAGSTQPSAAAIASHLLHLPSEGVSLSYHSARPHLSYLAPDITQAILDGRQPRAHLANGAAGPRAAWMRSPSFHFAMRSDRAKEPTLSWPAFSRPRDGQLSHPQFRRSAPRRRSAILPSAPRPKPP